MAPGSYRSGGAKARAEWLCKLEFAACLNYNARAVMNNNNGLALVAPRVAPALDRDFRPAVLGGPMDFYALAVSGAVSVALLLLGCLYFRRVERSFADII